MPSERDRLFALLFVAGALLAVSTGTGVIALDDAPDSDVDVEPDALVENASETVSEASIDGVRTETVRRGERTQRVTVAVKEEPPDRSRIQLVRSTESDEEVSDSASETVVNETIRFDEKVINGSTLWQYDADESRVIRKQTDGYWISDTQSFGSHIEEMLEIYEFDHAGTEIVHGREAYVVEMTPAGDEAVELSIDLRVGDAEHGIEFERFQNETWSLAKETWWIDGETTYPVKQRLEWADESGETVASTTREYEDLTVDADHDTDVFEFDPPHDAEVVEPDRPEPEHFDTRREAADAVPFELPDPELDSEHDLVSVTVDERDDRTSALLLYYDGSTSISIGVSDGDQIRPQRDVVETDVGEIDGTLVATDGRPFISWDCGELAYRVHGPADAGTLVETAESIGCHTDGQTS